MTPVLRRWPSLGAIVVALSVLLHSPARAACETQRAAQIRVTADLAGLDRQNWKTTSASRTLYARRRSALLAQRESLAAVLRSAQCLSGPPLSTQSDGGGGSSPPPDIVIQTIACLPIGGFTRDDLVNQLSARLQTASKSFPDLIPAPNVQSDCVGGKETSGIWLSTAGSTSALQGIDILSSRGAVFAIQLTAAGAQNVVANLWAQQPHVWNDNGDPDPNGANIFTDFAIDYTPAKDEVTLAINGHHHISPGLDPGLKISFIDDLGILSNEPTCAHQTKFDYDANVLWAGLAFMPLPFSGAPINEIEAAFGSAGHSITGNPQWQKISIGCTFASLVPTQILLASTPTQSAGKLVFAYKTVSTDGTDGIVFSTPDLGDLPHVVARQPAILPNPAFVAPVKKSLVAGRVSARLSVTLRDLRADDNGSIPITWTSSGQVLSTANAGLYALVSFAPLPANRRTVGMTTKVGTVTIKATDADGLTANPTLDVYAHVIPDPSGDGKPISKKLKQEQTP